MTASEVSYGVLKKGTVEVVANWKAVTPADVDLHAEIMRDPSQYSTANALEETSVACVTWPGVMAAPTIPSRSKQKSR